MSVLVPDSIPSGVGDPVWDGSCDAGGEGRYSINTSGDLLSLFGIMNNSSGGSGELASELRGDEAAAPSVGEGGGEESALLVSESVSRGIVAAGRRTRMKETALAERRMLS